MAKPTQLKLADWNRMVDYFHNESDRGAAIIAGSFLEHALGTYLEHRVINKGKKLADRLFGPDGALTTFAQRINVAYAFDQISENQFAEFHAIREARNHFAHHPLDASFASPQVQKHVAKTFIFKHEEALKGSDSRYRDAYLITCGMLSATLLDKMEKEIAVRAAPPK
jgi:hypothetical protein